MNIHKELQEYIWPLKAGEKEELERSIIAEGCRDALVTAVIDGVGVLIDGHNRFEICERLGIDYQCQENKDIHTIAQAKDWMDANQLGRRNLTMDQYQISIGRRYNNEKKTMSESGAKKASVNITKAFTDEKLSKEYSISPKTVRNYAKKAEIFDKLKEEKPEVAEQIKIGVITIKDAVNEQKKIDRSIKIEEIKKNIEEENVVMPSGLFDVIAIDPPWAYEEHGGFSSNQHDPENNRGGVDYPTMTVGELKELEIPTKDNCVLFLWTTHSFLRDSFDILDAWGFKYLATMVWDKEKIGMGRNIRMQVEFCLLAKKGSPIINGSAERDIIRESRRQHSRKPEEFYSKVERMTIGRRLDYFARGPREGWFIYGAESDKF